MELLLPPAGAAPPPNLSPGGDGQRPQPIPHRHWGLYGRIPASRTGSAPRSWPFPAAAGFPRPSTGWTVACVPKRHRHRRQRPLRHNGFQGIGRKSRSSAASARPRTAPAEVFPLRMTAISSMPVPLRRGGDTVPGSVGGAGLQSSGTIIKSHQLVGIDQRGRPIPEGVHPDWWYMFGYPDDAASAPGSSKQCRRQR